MAKFNFFGLFKNKKEPAKKDVSVSEMSFSELMQKYNELTSKRVKLDLSKTDQIEKLDSEIRLIHNKLLKCFADKNNAEAQAFVDEQVNTYIEASKQKSKIKKRQEELKQRGPRHTHLRIKQKLSEPLSKEEQAELDMLENKIKESLDEMSYLMKKEDECDMKIMIADITLAKFRISSQKLEEFKASERAASFAETRKRLAEKINKVRYETQENDGHQPGEE